MLLPAYSAFERFFRTRRAHSVARVPSRWVIFTRWHYWKAKLADIEHTLLLEPSEKDVAMARDISMECGARCTAHSAEIISFMRIRWGYSGLDYHHAFANVTKESSKAGVPQSALNFKVAPLTPQMGRDILYIGKKRRRNILRCHYRMPLGCERGELMPASPTYRSPLLPASHFIAASGRLKYIL